MTAPLAGCIVLAYGGDGLHEPLVRSLLAEGVPPANVLVVHNPAGVATRRTDAGADGVAVAHMEANLGYAGGMNAGIRYFASRRVEWILLLTNDLRFHENGLRRLLEAAADAPGFGLLGPVLRASDGRLFYGGRRDRIGRVRFRWDGVTGPNAPAILEADWIQGSAVLCRTEVFEQIGLLDEAFFMYFEETELCLRAARAGWRIGVVRAAQAEQQYGHLKRPALHAYLMARNGSEYFRRAAGPLAVFVWLCRQVPPSLELLKVWKGRRSTPGRRFQAQATLRAKLLGILAFFARRSGMPPRWLWDEALEVPQPQVREAVGPTTGR
jgi:GT2 family glycosyltransferase